MTTLIGWLVVGNLVMVGIHAFIILEGRRRGFKVDMNIAAIIVHVAVIALAAWVVFVPH